MGRLVGLALAICLVMTALLAAAGGVGPGNAPVAALLLLAVVLVASTAAVVIGFTLTWKPDPTRRAAAIASGALALVAAVEASQQLGKLPQLVYYLLSLGGEAALTYGVMQAWLRAVKLSGPWAQLPPRTAAGTVGVVGACGLLGQSFLPLDGVALDLAFVRDIVLAFTCGCLAAALAWHRPLRLDPKSRRESLRLRLPPAGDGMRRPFQAICLGLGAAVILQLILRAAGADALLPLTAAGLAWVGVAWQGLADMAQLASEQRQGNVTSRLATNSARKFLRRHMTEGSQWAATVGLKTSNFVIDHDPDTQLHAQLPASIMQIRAEEISRCVVDVLGAMNLHSHAVGHRIAGAVDPEASVRPCIDALRLFAALYLDAGPLVERRIKGLAALLPIVDPGLARLLKARDMEGLIRRNSWFFHFDFGWIDQHVVHTPKLTRYDVRLGSLPSRLRHAMMDQPGYFVWLGADARDRLVQEAPALSNVVEARPVRDGDTGEPGSETLMFIIRFEQLIPRLQRYYDLDSMRRALLDFEPGQEAQRLASLLRLQVQKAQNATELGEALEGIASVPWRGFREKDGALQLILAVYQQALAKLAPETEDLSQAKDLKLRLLHGQLLDAVRAVGYPSQVLHNAQIDKLQLRDVTKLLAAAADRNSARFEEAWLLLATTDFSRYPAAQCEQVHEFLRTVPTRPGLAGNRLVQAKAVDALAALARRQDTTAAVQKTLDTIGRWFGAAQVDPDICCQLLDTKLFLSSQLGLTVDFGADVAAALDRAFKGLAADLGASHPKVVALLSRWQEYRSRIAGQAA
jgi:hypothetical protein